MRKGIFKLLAVTSLSSVYAFLFSVVQIVDVSADNTMPLEVEISDQSEEQLNETQITVKTDVPQTTVSLLSMKKPGIADYSPKAPAPEASKSENNNYGNPPEAEETTNEEQTTVPETEPPVTTPPETEPPATTPPVTTPVQTAPPETSAPETAPPQDNNSVPDNNTDYIEEQLTVYDMLTGEYYTGGAKEIVARAVVGEIWNIFPDEAVKAQAVATYTYIKKSNLQGRYPDTALKTDVYPRIYDLVDEVLGEAIYYNGEMIQAVFFASSCGYTNSSLNVWGVDYPYLRSVDCPLDETTDPNWGSTRTYTSAEVKDKVYNKLGISLKGDPSKWFKVISRLDNREKGWITEMSVGGNTTYTSSSGRTYTITGRTIRETVFGFGIKSAAFEVSYDKATDSFTFTTYGHGHGVGMSQYGAVALAEAGYNYKQILKHYYTGVEIY